MAFPAWWPTKHSFYPTGNTSPICLTQNLPPDVDATILLLGCGDPRNILYTLYSNESDSSIGSRKYDITCCDIESAILARNILLFTLVADDGYSKNTSQIWNIFYHFFLDDASNTLLLTQCRKLAVLSADMETWNNTEYSSFLRISSRLTLSELNRLWTLYAVTGTFTEEQKEQFKMKFVTEMKRVAHENSTNTLYLTIARAAGPLHAQATQLCAKAHHHYWQTGVTFTKQRDIASASTVNPTFAYTASDDCVLPHHGTCPLPVFHLATAFCPLQSSTFRNPCSTIFDLFNVAKSQFLSWSDTFRKCYSGTATRVVIRFLLGDVLATCHTLKAYADYGSLTAHERLNPWSMCWLTLGADYAAADNHSPPRRFTIIDTSNLVDHIGMLNILVATAPLLSRHPAATLLTETLLTIGEDPVKSFIDRLCCDPNSLFVLLDLAPSNYLSGFTTQSNTHEIISYNALSQTSYSPQYHERMVWRIPSLTHVEQPFTMTFDSTQLSGLLYNVYSRMFSHEDLSSKLQNISLSSIRDWCFIRYCRRSLGVFIRYITSKVVADWDQVLEHLLERISNGSGQFLANMDYFQDLLCHLHMLGLHTAKLWLPGHPYYQNTRVGRFNSWNVVPSVVCLVMPIPRRNLKALEDREKGPNSQVKVQIRSGLTCSAFSSLQITFGTVSVRGENEDAEAIITEDTRGKQGKSSAIIAFWAPVWALCVDPLSTSVALCVVSTPANRKLTQELGLLKELYSALLMDASKVHIVSRAPISLADEQLHLRAANCDSANGLPQLSAPPPGVVASLDSACRKVISFTRHIDITEPNVQRVLFKDGTIVAVTPTDGSSVELSIGSVFKRRLYFPPIADKSKARLRVARRSSWVEVIMPVPEAKLFALQDFSLICREGTVNTWNVHYVNLDRLPSLRVDKVDRLQWLNQHVGLALSDAERMQRDSDSGRKALTQVKDSIQAMIGNYTGMSSKSTRMDTFALIKESSGGIDTLIFATGLRLDLAAHTVVLDAFALPLEYSITKSLGPRGLSVLSNSTSFGSLAMSDEELVAWKHLLPALTERCRMWKHKTDCAYAHGGAIPISTEHRAAPMCNCGRGIVTDAFKACSKWAIFTPYVTRVAISPLFAVSYLDSILGEGMLNLTKTIMKENEASPSTGSRVLEGLGGGLLCCKCGKKPPQVKLSACSVCKAINYCGRDCQVADWKKHKAMCKTL